MSEYRAGDNGKLTYQLQTSSKSEPFTIDPVTGVISTTEKLDREVKSSFRLIGRYFHSLPFHSTFD